MQSFNEIIDMYDVYNIKCVIRSRGLQLISANISTYHIFLKRVFEFSKCY